MPINNVNSAGAEKGPGGGGRTTFRPPWVKDGPQPIPMPKAPWSKRQSLTTPADQSESKAEPTPEVPQLKNVKLQSKEIKVPVATTLKKTPASQLKPKVNEDTEVVKNGLQNLLRKTESVNEDDSKSTKSTIDERMAAKKAAAEASAPGSVEKPGKFVRPVLKKVAKVEAAPAPPPTKALPPKPVVVAPAKKVESESEEEETDSEEEETETETETESESEEKPVVVKKGKHKFK